MSIFRRIDWTYRENAAMCIFALLSIGINHIIAVAFWSFRVDPTVSDIILSIGYAFMFIAYDSCISEKRTEIKSTGFTVFINIWLLAISTLFAYVFTFWFIMFYICEITICLVVLFLVDRMNRKHSKRKPSFRKSHTSNVFVNTAIAVLSYVFTGLNFLLSGVMCIKQLNGVSFALIIFGLAMFMSIYEVLTDEKKRVKETQFIVLLCALHLLCCLALSVSFSLWYMAVYFMEVLVSVIIVFVLYRKRRLRNR